MTAPGDKSPALAKVADKRFRKLIENSREGLRLLDEDLQFTYRSASAERILGWDENDRSIYTIDALVHPDDLERVKMILYQVRLNAGLSRTVDFRSKHFDGHYIWLESTFTNHLDDPDINSIVCTFRDISQQRRDEEQLQQTIKELYAYKYVLNESSILSVTDQDGIITHINENFCRISKYGEDELIGQNHRIVSSGYHDEAFIRNLWATIANGEIWKGELRNKAKDGTYYWVDATIVPFLNEHGKPYQYVAIRHDITERKNDELRQSLLSEIALIFSEKVELNEMLGKVLELLADFGNFVMAEAWLIGADKNRVNLVAKLAKTEAMRAFYAESSNLKSFVKEGPFAAPASQMPPFAFWHHHDGTTLMRHEAAINAGLKTAYVVPLKHNNEVLGLLVLGSDKDEDPTAAITGLLERFGIDFGAEVKRKQLEQEINQVFNLAPDIICVAGIDRYFKKINPAMSTILEYSEEELLTTSLVDFIHPDDREATINAFENSAETTFHFENRFITKSGQIKWLAWTSTHAPDEGLFFSVARDITERKELQELLDKANTLARIGSWEVDLVTGTIYWSGMTREIHEAEPGYHPDIEAAVNFYKEGINREIMVKTMESAINDCTPGDVELQIVTANGNLRWVRVIVEAEFADGKCSRVYGSIQDIDVRKKAEIASKEALEERNTILESIDDAFFAVDKNWVVTYWNQMAEKLFSTPKIEVLNQNLMEKFPAWVGSESYLKYLEAIKTGRASRFEHKAVIGTWLETSVYPAENGLTVYVKDITNRRKADASALEALEERNTILESIDDAFFAVDKNWVVTYWNNKAENVLMTPRNKILNKNLWKVFSESLESESYKKYHEAVETNQAMHFEDYFEPLDKWYEISAYPSDKGLSVYFKDITDRKISETRLRELNENLQKHAKELAISNAELEQFAYVASHDLQEPLRMVTSFMTQLEKKYGDVVDDRGRQYIHFAVDGAKRMRQIILDLLDFSRVGRADDDLEDVDFNKLMNEILALYRRQIEDDGATITFDDLPTIHTYKTPIRQVFQNLVSNGLKYHKTGELPVISISCKETRSHYQFSVKDNGIGIAAEYFDKIFVIFQRLHNKDEYGGTGMGLAIAKKIVENLGGKIWIESKEGKGSVFYFTLLKNNK